MTLPSKVRVPTHNFMGKNSKKPIINEFKRRTYPKTVNLDESGIYCDNYSFTDLERAWNKIK